jgi:hypothetical protein
MKKIIAIIGLSWASLSLPAFALKEGVQLAPHKAVYDLVMSKSSGPSAPETANGRIVYDFKGGSCEGYILNFRQVMALEGGEKNSNVMDIRTNTFEAGDGASFRFRSESVMAGNTTQKTDGVAERKEDGSLSLKIRQPKKEITVLQDSPLFPSAHLKSVIEAARAEKTQVQARVFDGADDGRKIYDTYSVIGRKIDAGSGALEEAARNPALSSLARWPVTISYFTSGEGERMPIYTITFELYENGVGRDLVLDYGDFALRGRMTSLSIDPTPSAQPSCKD